MRQKQPNPIDKHVGSRVRSARLMLGMSQEKLGDGCGLTFQQIQKYEKGTNRIGSSRLVQIAGIVRQPITFFFADGTHGPEADEFLATGDGLRLAEAFMKIESMEVRRRVVALVKAISEES